MTTNTKLAAYQVTNAMIADLRASTTDPTLQAHCDVTRWSNAQIARHGADVYLASRVACCDAINAARAQVAS